MTAHFPRERRFDFRHLRFDQGMSGPPHQRLPTHLRHLVKQGLAGLNVGDNRRSRMAGQHIGREQHHDLIAPENAPLCIDRPDPVAITIEGEPKIASFGSDHFLQLLETFRQRRIGMMIGEHPVDLFVQQNMFTRQNFCQGCHGVTRRPVARIPGHLQLFAAVVILGKPRDVIIEDRRFNRLSVTARIRAFAGNGPQTTDIVAIKRPLAHHHLEAVIFGRIVRT